MKRTPRSCAASSRRLGVECASRYLLSITEPQHLVTRTRSRTHERMREREKQAAATFASLILSFGASHCCLKQLLTVHGFLSLLPASVKKQHMDAQASQISAASRSFGASATIKGFETINPINGSFFFFFSDSEHKIMKQ